MRIGTVVEVRRHPVKSLRGQPLAAVEVDEHGVRGDRGFGIFDTATGRLLSAKTVPALMQASAVLREDGEVSISLPADEGGVSRVVASDDVDVDAALSEWLGRNVELRRPQPEVRAQIDIEVDGAMFTFPSRPGSLADGGAFHLLTTASLRAIGRLHPSPLWTADRFRPNVVVALDSDGAGFAEDDWVGKGVRIGGVDVHVDKRCDRCILVTRPTADAVGDGGLLRALHRHHGGDLGVKATITGVGMVRVGDDVSLG